jgi:hypothetical protein
MAGVEAFELNLTGALPKQSNGSATRLSFAKAVRLIWSLKR